MTKLYIVIPCYNEQEVLPITAGILIKKVKNMMPLFVLVLLLGAQLLIMIMYVMKYQRELAVFL